VGCIAVGCVVDEGVVGPTDVGDCVVGCTVVAGGCVGCAGNVPGPIVVGEVVVGCCVTFTGIGGADTDEGVGQLMPLTN